MNRSEMGGYSPEMEERKFYQITPEQLDSLPDGTELRVMPFVDPKGERVIIKGKDKIDQDTRDGLLVYGFYEEDLPAGLEFEVRGVTKT